MLRPFGLWLGWGGRNCWGLPSEGWRLCWARSGHARLPMRWRGLRLLWHLLHRLLLLLLLLRRYLLWRAHAGRAEGWCRGLECLQKEIE